MKIKPLILKLDYITDTLIESKIRIRTKIRIRKKCPHDKIKCNCFICSLHLFCIHKKNKTICKLCKINYIKK